MGRSRRFLDLEHGPDQTAVDPLVRNIEVFQGQGSLPAVVDVFHPILPSFNDSIHRQFFVLVYHPVCGK